jgi:MFS family permease
MKRHFKARDRQHRCAGRSPALSLAVLLSSLGTSIANVALPNLAEAFNASFQEVQWIVLAYLLAITTRSSVSAGSVT